MLFRSIEVGDMGLQWRSLDKSRCRDGREQCCEERFEVVGIRMFAVVRHRRGRPAGDGAGVNYRKFNLGVIGIQVEEQLIDDEFKSRMRELVAPAEAVFLDAKVEAELVELPADEALELLQSVGQEESGLDALARVGFATLGLQTYLTAGPKEARAWTIPRDATAPEAAGVIHTDFQKGFIKAEVVSYDELLDAGSMAEAKARGKVRMEGKDYVMADGDVVEFRFNV